MHALADAAQSSGGAGTIILGFVIIIGSIAAYLAPMIVALARHVPNTGSVIVIDVLLGWTVVGWIISLAMACRCHHPQQIAVVPYGPLPPPQYPPYQAPQGGNGF